MIVQWYIGCLDSRDSLSNVTTKMYKNKANQRHSVVDSPDDLENSSGGVNSFNQHAQVIT
jgi:hypothetical protein